MLYTKEDIIRKVKEEDVEFIRLQFTDIFGQLKNVAITASQIEKAVNNQIMFDGSSIEGFVRIDESDQYLYPDLDSFTIFPWRPSHGRVARLICDVHDPDGAPFVGDPRYVLKQVIQKANDMGFDAFNVGPEAEFFLFQTDDEGKPTVRTNDEAGYFDLGPLDHGEGTRREICMSLEQMGFEIEASHHEVAQGQHEIDFKYADALRTADNIMTFKLAVKTLAQKNGLHATFMPKPIFGVNGSGMHTNMSLFRDGKNAFYDPSDPKGLSNAAYSFIAGLLAAGLDGIEKGLTPPPEITDNIFAMSPAARRRRGIEALPGSLEEALVCMKKDKLIMDTLGEHVTGQYIAGKEAEWEEYRTRVSSWERDKYMILY